MKYLNLKIEIVGRSWPHASEWMISKWNQTLVKTRRVTQFVMFWKLIHLALQSQIRTRNVIRKKTTLRTSKTNVLIEYAIDISS